MGEAASVPIESGVGSRSGIAFMFSCPRRREDKVPLALVGGGWTPFPSIWFPSPIPTSHWCEDGDGGGGGEWCFFFSHSHNFNRAAHCR